MRALLPAVVLLALSCSPPPRSAPAAQTERTCPDPIGRIVLEDCDKVAAKYDELRFAGVTRALGTSVLDRALEEADRSVSFLKEERRTACVDRSTCKFTDPEYREVLRRLDEAYMAMLGLHEQLLLDDARRGTALIGELRTLRSAWPKPPERLFPSGIDGKTMPHFRPQPASNGYVAFTGLDYLGADLLSERNQSQPTCAKLCEGRGTDCQGFVLGTGRSQGICWIKSGFQGFASHPQRTAYLPQRWPLAHYVVILDLDVEGTDLAAQPAPNPLACAELCDNDKNCTSFLYSPADNVCQLRGKLGRLILEPGQQFYCNPSRGACP